MIVVVFRYINVFEYILVLDYILYMNTSLYFNTRDKLYEKIYNILQPFWPWLIVLFCHLHLMFTPVRRAAFRHGVNSNVEDWCRNPILSTRVVYLSAKFHCKISLKQVWPPKYVQKNWTHPNSTVPLGGIHHWPWWQCQFDVNVHATFELRYVVNDPKWRISAFGDSVQPW